MNSHYTHITTVRQCFSPRRGWSPGEHGVSMICSIFWSAGMAHWVAKVHRDLLGSQFTVQYLPRDIYHICILMIPYEKSTASIIFCIDICICWYHSCHSHFPCDSFIFVTHILTHAHAALCCRRASARSFENWHLAQIMHDQLAKYSEYYGFLRIVKDTIWDLSSDAKSGGGYGTVRTVGGKIEGKNE